MIHLIAGVDEAGRGPLAGPVVAAAVILDPERKMSDLRDSKALTAQERERLATRIRAEAIAWAVAHADVAIVASGTATLQAALARCPHIIFYRVKALTEWYVRRKYLLPYVGLPNVLAGRFVVPEFLQEEATAENLTQAAVNLYDDTVTRRRLEALFGRFAEQLNVDTERLASAAVVAELQAS